MRRIRRAVNLLVALVRELADENGYRRYLTVAGRQHSPEAWRIYIDQKHRRKYQNAKCC